MITADFAITYNPNWALIPLQEVLYEVDATAGDVTITLPRLSTLNGAWNVKFTIVKVAGTHNVIIVASGSTDPDDTYQDLLSGGTTASLTQNGTSFVIGVQNEGNWTLATETNAVKFGGVVASATRASFATDAYKLAPAGTQIAVTNYNTTGSGCVVFKYRNTQNTYEDWIILSTADGADTGAIGANPSA